MGKSILVDDDQLEHLLNCMAQLNFLPISGMHADEPIIRKAYREMRDVLSQAVNEVNACPPLSPADEKALSAMHASAPTGYKCSDCTMDGEPCPLCYKAAWQKRHPNVLQIATVSVGEEKTT